MFWVPVEISFNIEYNDYHVFVFIFFLIDIILNLNTAYFMKGFVVINRRKIINHYMKNYFIFDFITAIVYLLDALKNNSYSFYFSENFKFLFYLRIRTLNMLYDKIIEKFKLTMKLNASTIDLINLMFYSFFALHLVACFFYYISIIEIDTDQTWLYKKNLLDEDLYTKYLYSLYWSTTTILTVGYGDITPNTKTEIGFTIAIIVFGCMLFAYIINAIGVIATEINKENIIFK